MSNLDTHLSASPAFLITALSVAEGFALLVFGLPGNPGLPATLLFGLATLLAVGFLFWGWKSARSTSPWRFTGKDDALAHASTTPAPPSQDQCLANHRTVDAPPYDGPIPYTLLITKDPRHRREIVDNLRGWGRRCNVVESCVEASYRLLNQPNPGRDRGPEILIVDAKRLEMPPTRFASLIRKQPGLARLRVFCLTHRNDSETTQHLLRAGFDALIESPVDKTQLFATIEGGAHHDPMPPNVISLHHYRQKGGKGISKTILLAEQHAATRSHLTRLLRKAGHQVLGVENGEQALDTLETRNIDLAVINLQLPIMNGTQVVKLHRFTTPHRHWVPFIAIASENTPTTLRLCRELQFRACLFKPVPDNELLKMIAATPAASVPAAKNDLLRIEPRFHHSDLLDRRMLHALNQLDNGQGFLSELIGIFVSESDRILDIMGSSVEKRNHPRFIEQSQILMDNSGQLGAFALYEMCLSLTLLDRTVFASSAEERFFRLSMLVSSTIDAFKSYLAETETRHSDHS